MKESDTMLSAAIVDQEITDDLDVKHDLLDISLGSSVSERGRQSFRHVNPATLLMAEKLRDAMLGREY
jgi:hypothetical protein